MKKLSFYQRHLVQNIVDINNQIHDLTSANRLQFNHTYHHWQETEFAGKGRKRTACRNQKKCQRQRYVDAQK